MNTLDLNAPPPGQNLKVTIEPEEHPWDRGVRLAKDVPLFLTAPGLVGIIVWLAVATLQGAEATEEEKKWAMSILTAAAGGIIGYLLKR